MNWVGGARTRVLIKQERRKQKEYFERNRLKSKMKLLGILSPAKHTTVSLDLLNLYMVNQISCKKKAAPEMVKKPTHVNMSRDIKVPLRQFGLELPGSPHCRPSRLCLDDAEDDSMYCQKPGGMERCAPIKSSQAMESYSMVEPQFDRIENCSSTPPCFSAELSSNRHIPNQNFPHRITPSPGNIAYEEKQNEQLSNVNCSDSLVSKLDECQVVLSSPCKTPQFGTFFERLNNPGNGNFLAIRPDTVMDEDYRSMNEKQQVDFITEKQPGENTWGENRKVPDCLGDVSQPTHSLLSENHDSSVSQNMIDLLSIDQQRNTVDKHDHGNLEDSYLVTSSDENHHSTNGCTGSIYAVPESIFSNSLFNETNFPEKCQSYNYQKEYSNDKIHGLTTYFENYYPPSFEKQGKLENYYQEKTSQKNIQESQVSSRCNIPLEELWNKQSWDFRLSEILLRGETRSVKGRMTPTKTICVDSSLDSQSPSYSPRPTDSCFSSSPEMPSSDEDQGFQRIEDSNKISIKTTEISNDFNEERMVELSGGRLVNVNARVHKQDENFYQSSMKNNTDQFPQSQCNSAHILQNSTNKNYILRSSQTCDVGIQTEREPRMVERLDAAIQCVILADCTCRKDVSFFCTVERCVENTKADTTGGQEILTNHGYSQISV